MKLRSIDPFNTLHRLFSRRKQCIQCSSLQRTFLLVLGIPTCSVLNPGYLRGYSHHKEQADLLCKDRLLRGEPCSNEATL